MSLRNQNLWTPEAKTGVNYFKHTTKHFLTPYGKTHGVLTSREILDKLFFWNCEWLTQPNYAISELADTLFQPRNLGRLQRQGLHKQRGRPFAQQGETDKDGFTEV